MSFSSMHGSFSSMHGAVGAWNDKDDKNDMDGRDLQFWATGACGYLGGGRAVPVRIGPMLGAAAPIPFDPGTLRLASDLRRGRIEPSLSMHQVRRGVWIDAAAWALLDPAQRHAAFVHATALLRRREDPLLCAVESAAAVWGLPRIEHWPRHVRHLVTDRRLRGSAGSTCPSLTSNMRFTMTTGSRGPWTSGGKESWGSSTAR